MLHTLSAAVSSPRTVVPRPGSSTRLLTPVRRRWMVGLNRPGSGWCRRWQGQPGKPTWKGWGWLWCRLQSQVWSGHGGALVGGAAVDAPLVSTGSSSRRLLLLLSFFFGSCELLRFLLFFFLTTSSPSAACSWPGATSAEPRAPSAESSFRSPTTSASGPALLSVSGSALTSVRSGADLLPEPASPAGNVTTLGAAAPGSTGGRRGSSSGPGL